MFERGVILAPVADAVRGLLYSWQKKLTTSLHPQLFTQIRATKPLRFINSTVKTCRHNSLKNKSSFTPASRKNCRVDELVR
jgi:hypothetical protein